MTGIGLNVSDTIDLANRSKINFVIKPILVIIKLLRIKLQALGHRDAEPVTDFFRFRERL